MERGEGRDQGQDKVKGLCEETFMHQGLLLEYEWNFAFCLLVHPLSWAMYSMAKLLLRLGQVFKDQLVHPASNFFPGYFIYFSVPKTVLW